MKEASLESCSALPCQRWVPFRQAEQQSLQTWIPDLRAASVSPQASQKCFCLSSRSSPTFTGAWPHHTWPPVGLVLFEDKRLSLSLGPVQGQPLLDLGFWSLVGKRPQRQAEAFCWVEAGPQFSAWSYPFLAEDENAPAQTGLHDGCGEATKCPSLITGSIWFPA